MLFGQLTRLVQPLFRRSFHISPKLNQAMGIDGNNILAESLKKQVCMCYVFNTFSTAFLVGGGVRLLHRLT